VSGKNVVAGTLDGFCISFVDVSFFAGHPHKIPSTAGGTSPRIGSATRARSRQPFPYWKPFKSCENRPSPRKGDRFKSRYTDSCPALAPVSASDTKRG